MNSDWGRITRMSFVWLGGCFESLCILSKDSACGFATVMLVKVPLTFLTKCADRGVRGALQTCNLRPRTHLGDWVPFLRRPLCHPNRRSRRLCPWAPTPRSAIGCKRSPRTGTVPPPSSSSLLPSSLVTHTTPPTHPHTTATTTHHIPPCSSSTLFTCPLLCVDR